MKEEKKSKQFKVLSYENLPAKFPITESIVAFLLLQNLNAPLIIFIISELIFLGLFAYSYYRYFKQEEYSIEDMVNDEEDETITLHD